MGTIQSEAFLASCGAFPSVAAVSHIVELRTTMHQGMVVFLQADCQTCSNPTSLVPQRTMYAMLLQQLDRVP